MIAIKKPAFLEFRLLLADCTLHAEVFTPCGIVAALSLRHDPAPLRKVVVDASAFRIAAAGIQTHALEGAVDEPSQLPNAKREDLGIKIVGKCGIGHHGGPIVRLVIPRQLVAHLVEHAAWIDPGKNAFIEGAG